MQLFCRLVVQSCLSTSLSCQIPTRNCKYLVQRYILVLSQRWRCFSKTINECSVNFQKIPTSKVKQLAKKIEASKATTHHIKQVASDPQATQINLMRHQRTNLPPSKSKQKQHSFKSRSKSHKRYSSEHKQQVPPYKKKFDPYQAHSRKGRCFKCGDSKHVEGFKCPARKFQCKTCNKYGHFASLCYKKKVSL